MTVSIPRAQAEPGTVFLAGNLALDFLNTRMRVGGELVDLLRTGEDVRAWLAEAGLPAPPPATGSSARLLVRVAYTLRESIRALVEKRKAGQRADPSVLNRFLAHADSHPRLVWTKSSPILVRVRREHTPEAVLAPVAEAAAELLATADFDLVKHCEDATCVFWFVDQTKSHHRRWCSMELCGNRHKVAAYRSRRRLAE